MKKSSLILITFLTFSVFSCEKNESSSSSETQKDTIKEEIKETIDTGILPDSSTVCPIDSSSHTDLETNQKDESTTSIEGTKEDVKQKNNLKNTATPSAKINADLSHNQTNNDHSKTTVETKKVEEIKAEVVQEFNHNIFDNLLKKYVTASGNVNYNGFKSERSTLQGYLTLLKNNEPEADWSANKKLAYYINLYNAATIELILKNNTPSSIMNINGGKAWDLMVVEMGTKKISLNNLEHDIIRKKFNEPRIHFACVCAAKSCPKLLNTAYTEQNINSKLTEQTKWFINNSAKNQISDGKLVVSKLFEWYAGDFGEVNAFIRKYYNGTFKDDKKIEFLEYDWSLNN